MNRFFSCHGFGRSGKTSAISSARISAGEKSFSPNLIAEKLKFTIENKLGISVGKVEEISLFHIRGVSDVQLGSETVRTVIFEPEFLYTAQVGTSRLAGVSLPFELPEFEQGPFGLGDPEFPNFDHANFVSVASLEPSDLIFPAIAGQIMVGMKKGIPEQEVLRRLSTILENPTAIIAPSGLYSGQCPPFDEDALISRLENEIEGIRYAEVNRVVRLIDFSPGWMVDQIT